jgi:hypothetical protein
MFENSTEHHYFSHVMSRENEPLPIEDFKTADVFLYHPLSLRWGIYSTEDTSGVLQYVSKTAIRICVPFFYLDVYPIYEYGTQVRHGGALDKYKSITFDDFGELYVSLQLDFELKKRFQESLLRLRKQETFTDVKFCDFIEKHFRTHKLLNCVNHPTAPIYHHVVNQIFQILGIEKRYNEFEYSDEVIHINPYPDSVFMVKELGIEYPLTFSNCLYNEADLLSKWKQASP